ncbi:hypothetical protein [Chitinophaga sp. sic0106]|nr:hypothetical protein [Chitinophaga sp. sic0106]MBV7528744.1 hypothetical protein [Chitinophaga sp. sic0106]
MMTFLDVVHTTNFYKVGDFIGSIGAPAAIIIFALMFLIAWVKYAKA